MTASEIFELRTGKDGDDWISLAEGDVRMFLNYGETESLDSFASTVGNIAVLYYERDKAVKSMAQAAGVKSESFTEGKVSVKQDYLTSSDVSGQYEEKVDNLLAGIKRYRRARIPEVNDADEG